MSVTTEFGTGYPFRIGNVFMRAWEVMSANFVLFFAIAVLIVLPITIVELSYNPHDKLTPEALQAGAVTKEWLVGYAWASGLGILAVVLLSTIGYGVCILKAFQHLSGEHRSLGDNLVQALLRFFPLLGVTVLFLFGLLAGSLLLIVPGIMLAVRWGVSTQVCVIERTGPIASLRRSAQLTDGNRWPLLGLIFLSMLGGALVPALLDLLLTSIGGRVGKVLGGLLIQGVIGGYLNCVSIMAYHELRRAKEGINNSRAMRAVFE